MKICKIKTWWFCCHHLFLCIARKESFCEISPQSNICYIKGVSFLLLCSTSRIHWVCISVLEHNFVPFSWNMYEISEKSSGGQCHRQWCYIWLNSGCQDVKIQQTLTWTKCVIKCDIYIFAYILYTHVNTAKYLHARKMLKHSKWFPDYGNCLESQFCDIILYLFLVTTYCQWIFVLTFDVKLAIPGE